MKEDELLLIEEILVHIAEEEEGSGDYILHYDRLSIDDPMLCLPIALSVFASSGLATVLDDKQFKQTIAKADRCDREDDFEGLASAVNDLMHALVFVVNPDAPPFWVEGIPEGLSIALMNYYILWHALWNHLEYGDKETSIEWTRRYDVERMSFRFPFLVSNAWVALALLTIEYYVDAIMEIVEEDESELNDLDVPLAIGSITEDESMVFEVGDPLLGLKVQTSQDHQYYEIWVRMRFEGGVEFHFCPKWEDKGDDYHRQMLLGFMLIIEKEIREMTGDIRQAWKAFLTGPEKQALEEEGDFLAWWKESLDGWKDLIFSSRDLSRGLGTLDMHVQTERVEQHAQEFRRQWKKHIPQELRKALHEASFEIGDLFKTGRGARLHEKGARARKHFKDFPARFKWIQQKDLEDIDFKAENPTRDARRLILPRVAERMGKKLSARQIEKYLKRRK